MTRLTKQDLDGLDYAIESYDYLLKQRTGLNLLEIACFAAGVSVKQLKHATSINEVSVVPITAGKGVIPGFTQSVASIIKHLGFKVKITDGNDVSGIADAITETNITFMADDNRFIAINFSLGTVIDNAHATARGYVAALNAMVNGLNGRDVLVIGAGRVGTEVIKHLQKLEANVAVFDPKLESSVVIENLEVKVEDNLFRIMPLYKYIIDASPEPEFMKSEYLHSNVAIAAPGIPLGLTKKAYEIYQDRVIHDPLQLGVATMLALAI